MINQKMYELGTKKSTIRTIFEFGRKRAAEVGEENVYDFSLGNPNVPTPEFIKAAAVDVLTNMEPSAVHGYTVAPGAPQTRAALAESVNKRFGTNFAAKNFFMTAGAAAAITICFKALAQPEDEFITFAPFFPEYRAFVESVGGKLVVVPVYFPEPHGIVVVCLPPFRHKVLLYFLHDFWVTVIEDYIVEVWIAWAV